MRVRWPFDLERRPYSVTNIGLSMELLDRNPSQKGLGPGVLIASLNCRRRHGGPIVGIALMEITDESSNSKFYREKARDLLAQTLY